MQEDLEPLASPNAKDLKQLWQQNEKIEVLHEQHYIYTGNINKYLQQKKCFTNIKTAIFSWLQNDRSMQCLVNQLNGSNFCQHYF